MINYQGAVYLAEFPMEFLENASAGKSEPTLPNLLIFEITTLIISKKPGNTGISRDIRTEFTTDLLLSD